jgi:eukaryotic-like serine/threonine-protein kinase
MQRRNHRLSVQSETSNSRALLPEPTGFSEPELEQLLAGSVCGSAWTLGEARSGAPSSTRCLAQLPSFAPGEVLGKRYAVEGLLGRGGMGEVFSALDLESGARVALKAVLPTRADDPRAIRQLRREHQLMSRVRHPNVCRVHEMGVHDDDARDVIHFMTMEWLRGSSLRARQCPGRRRVAEILLVARQVLRALEAVHSAGVVHLDVKSDNVVLCESGAGIRSVLIDFGLARSLTTRQRTGHVRVSGSMGYMAPEQLRGETLSPRTDLFAFGVVLYELLTGTFPFKGRNVAEVHAAIQRGPIRPRDLSPEVPASLESVALRCLQVDPEERFPDVVAALQALDGDDRDSRTPIDG